MCGIAGILAKRGNPETISALRRMISALGHRGPDDCGTTSINVGPWQIAFGHTRLAILDLSSAGHQPMGDVSGQRWITYNGEIYNYRALRQELGVRSEESVVRCQEWRSNTDTEVILRAYERWGQACLERFRGMFAFGLWDGDANRLLLARDQFGIKPLYYYASGDLLIFASEVRTLLASGLVPRRLSPEGLASYLSFGSVETPLTIIRNVQSLPPGHLLVADPTEYGIEVTVEQYYEPPFAAEDQSLADRRESVNAVRTVLEESVQAHLVSDVPVGAFLSGGIDSSVVVALMSQASVEKPRTFSVVFPEQEFSEAPYARRMAERFGAEHAEIRLSEADLLAMLPDSLLAMDQPTMDGVNTYVISRAVRKAGITVALSGLGGDELFGGYPSFARLRSAGWLRAIPRRVRQGFVKAVAGSAAKSSRVAKAIDMIDSGLSPTEVYTLSRRLFGSSDLKALFLPFLEPVPDCCLQEIPSDGDPFLSISLHELGHYMANTLLRDTDCMSMAHGLEVRVPFVDREVVRTVLSIPSAHKVDGRRPKPLLLDAIGDLLPQEVWRRPKMGFTLPFERWMLNRLAPEVETVVSAAGLFKALGMNPCYVQEIWRWFQRSPRQVGWSRPWALYVLGRWSQLNGVAM